MTDCCLVVQRMALAPIRTTLHKLIIMAVVDGILLSPVYVNL